MMRPLMRPWLRSLYRFAIRWLLDPALVGGIFMVALVALWAKNPVVGDTERVLGQDLHEVASLIRTHYARDIAELSLALATAAFVIGGLLGTVAEIFVRARDFLARKRRRSVSSRAALSLVVTAALWALWMLYGLAKWPQIYTRTFYERDFYEPETWRRSTQVFASDVLGPNGVLALAAALGALFLIGSPARIMRLARTLDPRRMRFRRRLSVLAAGAGMGVLFLVPALHRKTPRAPGARPNVLILSADSLRADRLDPRVAPHLTALAEQSTRFDRAYVAMPRTFSSWMTWLTGRYPHHHGIRSMFARWDERAQDFDTLPSRLRRAGYATAVVSDFAGDVFTLADFGFDQVHAPVVNFRQLVQQRVITQVSPLLPMLHSKVGRAVFPSLRRVDEASDPFVVADDATRILRSLRDRPFFLTVFFSTTHFPYAAPAPYYARFTDPAFRGRDKYQRRVGLRGSLTAEGIAQVRGLYDGAVASVDAAAEQVLAALESEGLADNTIVVVTSDHGESLHEYGREGHGNDFFGDEGTHVPLVIHDPRRAGGRTVPEIVRSVDLAPTLYELTGVEAPRDVDGESLVPALRGEPTAPKLAYAESEIMFANAAGSARELRVPYPGFLSVLETDSAHEDQTVLKREYDEVTLMARQRMVRDERFKLVYAPTRAGPRYWLYDTKLDPAEMRDVSAEFPRERDRLEAALWRWMLEDPRMEKRNGMLVPKLPHGLLAPVVR
jgi:arylsulfatase A-like enzyme